MKAASSCYSGSAGKPDSRGKTRAGSRKMKIEVQCHQNIPQRHNIGTRSGTVAANT